MAKRISQLTALTSASLDTTLLGIDRGISYKVELDVLADAVKDRINTIDSIRLGSLENFTASYSASVVPTGTISGSSQISSFGFVSGSYETTGRGIVSSSANLVTTSSFNSYTASISTGSLVSSISNLNTFTASVSTASLVSSISNLNTVTSSYETKGRSIVSGSSQLTSSFDIRYAVSASYLTSLNGTISSSSQLTSSFDTRYTLSGSVQPLPSNLLSSSAQITAFGFVSSSTTIPAGTISGSSQLTSSFDTRYTLSGSVVSGTTPSGTISGSSQLTSSFDLRYLVTGSVTSSINALNTFSASENTKSTTLATYTSSLNIWTSSVATTGSNSFNGNQTITGSLVVSAVAVVNGGITVPTGSVITLTTGSSISVDSSGAITGSLTGSVFGIGDVVVFSSSVNSRINNITSSVIPAGTISSSAQITTLGFISSSTPLTSLNTFTGSVLLTSSFNSYTASISTASLVSSITNLNNATSSYEIIGRNIISGSSQLTSSFDLRYSLSGSGGSIPTGTISSSAQITAFGFVSSSTTTIPDGTISGSSQITSLGFATTGSNVFTGSQNISGSVTASVFLGTIRATNGVVSGSSQVLGGSGVYSGSLYSAGARFSLQDILLGVGTTQGIISSDGNKPTLFRPNGISSNTVMQAWPLGGVSIGNAATFTYAGLALDVSGSTRYTGNISVTGSVFASNGFTGSIAATNGVVSGSSQITLLGYATTGSNSFNGNQTITGSLTITTGSFFASQITANTASLYLTSGSNLYVQNNGVVEITGSLTISSGSITMPDRPAFRVVGTGGGIGAVRTLSGSAYTLDYQQGSGWDISTGTFTAPISGLYQVNLITRTNSNTYNAITQFIVYKNNTGGTTGTPQIMIEYGNNTTMNHAGGSTISKLVTGDTLRLILATGSGSFDTNDNFSVAYIG